MVLKTFQTDEKEEIWYSGRRFFVFFRLSAEAKWARGLEGQFAASPLAWPGPKEGSNACWFLDQTRSTCYCNRPNLWSDAAVPVATRLLDTTRTKQMSATLLLKNKTILMMHYVFMSLWTSYISRGVQDSLRLLGTAFTCYVCCTVNYFGSVLW